MAVIIDYCLKYDNREIIHKYLEMYVTREERKYREILKYRNDIEEYEIENGMRIMETKYLAE